MAERHKPQWSVHNQRFILDVAGFFWFIGEKGTKYCDMLAC